MPRPLLILLIFLCAAAAPVWADARLDMKAYLALKQDADLYVGEGVAEAKDFNNSLPKALEAARTRARAALAEAIRVRVQSETAETATAANGAVSETFTVRSRSQADLVLENVRFAEFTDFPEAGQATAVASLSKQDYRRQLAGQAVRVYRPEWGLRLGGSAAIISTANFADQSGQLLGGPALDLLWRDFSLGYQLLVGSYLPAAPSPNGPPAHAISASVLTLGWDWAPWALRVQPLVPVQLHGTFWNADPNFARTFGAAAGLGLRWWVSDGLALQLQGLWNQDLSGGDVTQSGGNTYVVNGHTAHVELTGPQLGAAITWCGF